MSRSHGDVVKQAESHGPIALRMVTGRPDQRQRPSTGGAIEHVIDGCEDGPRGQARNVESLGRGKRIRVERRCPPGSLTDQPDVIRIVDAGELLIGRPSRLEHRAPAPAELTSDDLHHHMPFDPFRMAGWSEVIRKPRGGNDRQRH